MNTPPVTREQMDATMGQIRDLTIERNFLNADREAQLKAIDDRLGPQLQHLNETLQTLTAHVKAWADENPEEFAGKKSLETTHGTLGWRMGQWQVEKLAGWIWSRTKKSAKAAKVVLELLKDKFGKKYVRIKEEVDKDALIADRGTLTAEQLQSVGVRLLQEEHFFVDPNLEETVNRRTA